METTFFVSINNRKRGKYVTTPMYMGVGDYIYGNSIDETIFNAKVYLANTFAIRMERLSLQMNLYTYCKPQWEYTVSLNETENTIRWYFNNPRLYNKFFILNRLQMEDELKYKRIKYLIDKYTEYKLGVCTFISKKGLCGVLEPIVSSTYANVKSRRSYIKYDKFIQEHLVLIRDTGRTDSNNKKIYLGIDGRTEEEREFVFCEEKNREKSNLYWTESPM